MKHNKSKRNALIKSELNRTGKTLSDIRAQAPWSTSFKLFVLLSSCCIALLAGLLYFNQVWVSGKRTELRRACEQARNRGDWIELEILARQWATVEPSSVEPWSMAAAAARAMGDLPKCAAYLGELPDSAPLEALHELSQLQLEELKDPLQARRTLERILDLHPADVESSQILMTIDSMLCQRAEVRKEAETAIDRGRDSPVTYVYLISHSWITFNNGYDLNQTWLGEQTESELFEVAAATHLIQGQEIAAIQTEGSGGLAASVKPEVNRAQLLDDLCRRFPSNLELLNLKLTNLIQASDTDAVDQLIRRLPQVASADHRFWRYRGWLAVANGDFIAAAKYYARAIELCPTDWASQNELAGVLRRTQGIEAAAEMQLRAKLGIEVATTILAAPNFLALSAEQYKKMADYLESCGQVHYADRLRRLL